MSNVPYTYSIVKYVHDPAAAETLNIGVVMWAPSCSYLGVKLEYRFERLSQTFADFDGENFKRSLRQFESAVEILNVEYRDSLILRPVTSSDVKGVLQLVWSDEDLSFRLGATLAGITDNLEYSLNEIFYRMVESQYPRQKDKRRTEEEVWSTYHRELVCVKANRSLQPKQIVTEEFSIKFDHAFKNEKWHMLEPVSLDYVKPESIQKRATTWLGNATAMQGHPELGTLYILLGKPKHEDHYKAYIRAKNLLHKMPVKHEIYDEDEAKDFARDIADYMKRHGVESAEEK